MATLATEAVIGDVVEKDGDPSTIEESLKVVEGRRMVIEGCRSSVLASARS